MEQKSRHVSLCVCFFVLSHLFDFDMFWNGAMLPPNCLFFIQQTQKFILTLTKINTKNLAWLSSKKNAYRNLYIFHKLNLVYYLSEQKNKINFSIDR